MWKMNGTSEDTKVEMNENSKNGFLEWQIWQDLN
jgi:hypothetical protein